MENNTSPNDRININNIGPSSPEPKNGGAIGPIIGVIIILAIILIGGIYYFMSIQENKVQPIENSNENMGTEDTSSDTDFSAVIETQSNSDDLDSIETDLNSFGGAEIDQSTAY